jgi:uncharacterized linocin/CFP29 family protein
MFVNVNTDFIGGGQAQGEVANLLMKNGRLDLGAMRPFIGNDGRTYIDVYKGGDRSDPACYKAVPINANGVLRRDEWKQLDEALVVATRYRLGGVDDLIANGLTFNLGNAMGTTVLEWHDVSDGMAVTMSMDGVTRGLADRPKFQTNYLPIPILHVDYEVNARVLEASRKLGNPLDTTMAEMAARRIKEYKENQLFTDVDYAYGELDDRSRNKIYSYVNHPDRNSVTLGTNWDASAKTPAGILNDVLNMIKANVAAYHYGPYMLYVPTEYGIVLYDDYDTVTPGTTIKDRIMKIDVIKGIKVIDTLADNTVLLVQMTPDVVRLVQGFGLQTVEYQTEAGWVHKFKVVEISVPQIRSDQNGKSGIVQLSA